MGLTSPVLIYPGWIFQIQTVEKRISPQAICADQICGALIWLAQTCLVPVSTVHIVKHRISINTWVEKILVCAINQINTRDFDPFRCAEKQIRI